MTPLPSPQRWAELSPLVDAVLDLPASARAGWIRDLARGQPQVAAELAALLAKGEAAQSQKFLDAHVNPPTTPTATTATDRPAVAAEPSLAGQALGPYVLQEPLGQGGSGTVWRARRADGRFDGSVAIKLLHLSLLGRAGAERFQREGHILARLSHPHIARLLDAGIAPGGQPYLVIELVQGQRLDRHCQALQLGVAQRLALFADVLAAVAHAHGHGVVHRDIKPGNILVTPEGQVKLLDFGIAKLIEADVASADATDLTRAWGRALTPEYAAPEQLRGEPVTAATDVFALGVLLHELLTGRLPHPSRRLQFGALFGAPAGTANSETNPTANPGDTPAPKASSQVSDATLRRQLAGDLDTIIARALKPAATERYPSASAMLDDLQRHRNGQAVLARADSWGYRARKFVLRNKAACAVLASVALALLGGAYAQVAVLLALAAGTLMALWQAQAARTQAAAALQAQQRAEDVKRFIASIFTQATPRQGQGGVVTAADLLDAARVRIDTELAGNPAVAGELGVLVAESCSQLGEVPLGAKALEAALPRCLQAFGAGHALTLQAQALLLEAHNGAGRFDAAEAMAAPLAAALRARLPALAQLLVFTLQKQSFVMAKRNDEPGAMNPLLEAITVAEQHLGSNHEETLTALGLLANTYAHFARNADALAASERAMLRTRQALGVMRPHTLLTQQERWYADALVSNGRPADAEPIARQVVLDQRALDMGDSARVVNAMTAHSLALAGMGRVEDAVATAREVLAQHRSRLPEDHVDTAYFLWRLALCLTPTRSCDEIDNLLLREEQIWQRIGHQAATVLLRRKRLRALTSAWRGDHAAAAALLDATDADARSVHPGEWTRLQRVRATSLRLQGRAADALAAARQAQQRCTDTNALAVDHAHAHTECGLSLLDLGQAEHTPAADTEFTLAQARFDQAQVLPSVVRSDAWLGQGRLHLLRGDIALAHDCFQATEQAWARTAPGSVWHAHSQAWLRKAG